MGNLLLESFARSLVVRRYEFVLQHLSLQLCLFRCSQRVQELTLVGSTRLVARESESHADRRFVGIDYRIVMNASVVTQSDRVKSTFVFEDIDGFYGNGKNLGRETSIDWMGDSGCSDENCPE